MAVNKKTGKLVWKDNSPGDRIMEGQWASPAYAEVNGKPQIIFPGGDGWLYAFEPATGKPIWKFNCNPKDAVFKPGGRGNRNYLMAPVVYDNKVYTGLGQNPENGAEMSHIWCVDLTKTGDLSAELDQGKPNPNSGVVWHFGGKASGDAPRLRLRPDPEQLHHPRRSALHLRTGRLSPLPGRQDRQKVLGGRPEVGGLGIALVGRRQGLPRR